MSDYYGTRIQKLESENAALRDLIKECIDVFEYGVNQWASAWGSNEETRGQKQIKKLRKVLES